MILSKIEKYNLKIIRLIKKNNKYDELMNINDRIIYLLKKLIFPCIIPYYNDALSFLKLERNIALIKDIIEKINDTSKSSGTDGGEFKNKYLKYKQK